MVESSVIDFVLKALGLIAAIIVSLYQWRNVNVIPKRRSTLKTDLEILKMLKPEYHSEDPSYQTIKNNVDDAIVKIYSKRNWAKLKEVPGQPDFIISITILLVFSIWTVYLLKDGFTPWALVFGFFALAGLGGIVHIIEESTEKSSSISNKKTG